MAVRPKINHGGKELYQKFKMFVMELVNVGPKVPDINNIILWRIGLNVPFVRKWPMLILDQYERFITESQK